MKLKTRTNQPVEYEIETTADIQHLSDSFLDSLKCGDIITKKTGNLKHTYIVTYKEEKHGICLSYFAAGYSETVSYDYTNGHWVYNSTDIFNAEDKQDKLVSGTNIKTINGTSLLGSGNIAISGGTKLYHHLFQLGGSPLYSLHMFSTEPNAYLTAESTILNLYMSIISNPSTMKKIVAIYYYDASNRYNAVVSTGGITYVSDQIRTYGSGTTTVGVDAITEL